MKKTSRITLIITITIVVLIAASIGAFFIYVGDYYKADEFALNALQSDDLVKVTYVENKYYKFEPIENTTSAFVFIPGGKVEACAYAPLMREIAKKGYLCILLEVKFNLAILDQNAPKGIQDEFKDIDTWIIGGHSLGGTVASMYLQKHPEEYSGIVLMGSYPQADISTLDINCVIMYGSNDKVLNMDKFEESKQKWPKATSVYLIEGGNHAQFGSYGNQKGDGIATITPYEQWAIAVAHMTPLLV